jgi:hypothetical protein
MRQRETYPHCADVPEPAVSLEVAGIKIFLEHNIHYRHQLHLFFRKSFLLFLCTAVNSTMVSRT